MKGGTEMAYFNRKTSITASVIGTLLGLAGILNHGIFEILQGPTPTNGHYIEAIGEAQRFWIHGTEGAFTLIQNFLYTGIAVVIVGLAVVVWSVKYMRTKYGPTVFIILMILMTLVGGGLGHLILYLPVWGFATRIHKPLTWWQKVLSSNVRKAIAPLWIYSLIATCSAWLMVMELGIFGYFPGQTNPDTILSIVFVLLFSTVILACFTFICAFAADIKSRN